MAFPAKIVYPLPPPTTNCLTPLQRAQLMRSTKKLGRILGTTPHFIDTTAPALGPLHVHLPFNDIDDEASTESVSSCSSVMTMASSCDPILLSRSGSVRSTITHSSSLRSEKSPESVAWPESWPSRKPPMLRLATPSWETIPASPGWTSSRRSHSPSSSVDERDDQRFTIRPRSDLSPDSSPTLPSFVIPSSNSDRRNKMERLRRKLGDDVPVDLVFPRETEAANLPSPELEKTLPPLPIPTVSQMAPRISSARDSISYDSPHHARRKIVAPKITTLNASTNDVRIRPEKRRYVKGQHSLRASIDMRDTKAKLCVIVESPGEHGSSWSEECGLSRYQSVLASEWYMSDEEEADVKKWSTRSGYEGWADRVGTSETKRRSYRKPPMTL